MIIKAMLTLMILVTMATQAKTIWLIGDSTVSSYSKDQAPLKGWGQMLQEYCVEDIVVVNKASSGRSTKSFLAEKRWEPIVEKLKQGDFVMIQFGHNDQKEDKEKLYAPHDGLFQELLTKYIKDTRSKGASPVLVTSINRRTFKDGVLKNSLGRYPQAAKDVAMATKTPLIDLNTISSNKFSEAGVEGTKKIFLHLEAGEHENYPDGKTDNSHFQESGARDIASWVVEDAQRQGLEISKLFNVSE